MFKNFNKISQNWVKKTQTLGNTSIPLGIKSCSKFQPSLLLFDSTDNDNHASVNIVIKINSPCWWMQVFPVCLLLDWLKNFG